MENLNDRQASKSKPKHALNWATNGSIMTRFLTQWNGIL